MKSFALFLFGLAVSTIVIGCKNPSSGTGTDTALTRYSVTYDANGGSGTVPTDSNTYTVGQIVTAKTMGGLTPPPGTTSAGWSTQVIGGTNVPAGGTIAMPSGGLTLYARWRF